LSFKAKIQGEKRKIYKSYRGIYHWVQIPTPQPVGVWGKGKEAIMTLMVDCRSMNDAPTDIQTHCLYPGTVPEWRDRLGLPPWVELKEVASIVEKLVTLPR
jgi:hypothetical protein